MAEMLPETQKHLNLKTSFDKLILSDFFKDYFSRYFI